MSQVSYKMSSNIPLSKILSFISYKNMNFLILDCPTDNTLPQYLREFKRNRVSDIVRVCEPTYSTILLSENNINVHDWQFRDGAVPPANIVINWLNLVEKKFGPLQQIRKEQNVNEEMNTENPTIAVHCVAGLGRAPVLVAIALIEAGMKPLQAVEHIRRYRRGAFNTNQLDFLDKYKRGQYTKKSNKFSLIKSKKDKERRSDESLKKGATNKSKSGEVHHSGKIFSFNKLFKSSKTTKSSQEVGVVN